MSKLRILADSGTIAGLIYERDQWHAWSVEKASGLPPPFFTCEAVIVETSFLLKQFPTGRLKLLESIERGDLQISFSLREETASVRALMSKYADLPMSLADACLVRMSELHENSAVFTVDSDFLIYRKSGRKKIPLISPF